MWPAPWHQRFAALRAQRCCYVRPLGWYVVPHSSCALLVCLRSSASSHLHHLLHPAHHQLTATSFPTPTHHVSAAAAEWPQEVTAPPQQHAPPPMASYAAVTTPPWPPQQEALPPTTFAQFYSAASGPPQQHPPPQVAAAPPPQPFSWSPSAADTSFAPITTPPSPQPLHDDSNRRLTTEDDLIVPTRAPAGLNAPVVQLHNGLLEGSPLAGSGDPCCALDLSTLFAGVPPPLSGVTGGAFQGAVKLLLLQAHRRLEQQVATASSANAEGGGGGGGLQWPWPLSPYWLTRTSLEQHYQGAVLPQCASLGVNVGLGSGPLLLHNVADIEETDLHFFYKCHPKPDVYDEEDELIFGLATGATPTVRKEAPSQEESSSLAAVSDGWTPTPPEEFLSSSDTTTTALPFTMSDPFVERRDDSNDVDNGGGGEGYYGAAARPTKRTPLRPPRPSPPSGPSMTTMDGTVVEPAGSNSDDRDYCRHAIFCQGQWRRYKSPWLNKTLTDIMRQLRQQQKPPPHTTATSPPLPLASPSRLWVHADVVAQRCMALKPHRSEPVDPLTGPGLPQMYLLPSSSEEDDASYFGTAPSSAMIPHDGDTHHTPWGSLPACGGSSGTPLLPSHSQCIVLYNAAHTDRQVMIEATLALSPGGGVSRRQAAYQQASKGAAGGGGNRRGSGGGDKRRHGKPPWQQRHAGTTGDATSHAPPSSDESVPSPSAAAFEAAHAPQDHRSPPRRDVDDEESDDGWGPTANAFLPQAQAAAAGGGKQALTTGDGWFGGGRDDAPGAVYQRIRALRRGSEEDAATTVGGGKGGALLSSWAEATPVERQA